MRKIVSTLCIIVLVLIGIGLVLLSSAGMIRAQSIYSDPHHFINKQIIWVVVSFCAFLFASYFDYRLYKRYPWISILAYSATVLLLVLTLPFPGNPFCHEANGSYRWLSIAGHQIGQPSELAKIIIGITMSVWMAMIGDEVRNPVKGVLVPMAVIAFFAGPLVLEPDFGAAFVVGVVALAVMFVAGTRIWHLLLVGIAGVVLLGLVVVNNPNRMHRLASYFDKDSQTVAESASTAAHQLKQSQISFQNGGMWGVGYNNSIQRYNYLPEAHTDFIFSIGGEEFGFFFSIFVLCLFLAFTVCGFLIANRVQDRLGRLMAFSMTFLLSFQAIFNIGVVTGCLPTKGIALPFLSYGGTNLIIAMFAVGTLVNIGRQYSDREGSVKKQLAKNVPMEL